ncbi:MAG TPA: GNAT family N-acetyltransferase [Sphingomonadales bacterium]|nr:GNAT family N-acetyltransferase [Sphingomonadales bacterium]
MLSWKPLTAKTWRDFETLAGKRGLCAGCWCMLWRLGAKDYEAGKGAKNKARLKRLAQAKRPPGIVVYAGGVPAAWCSVGPRADFIRLTGSKVLAPVDEKPVWSLTCFYVAPAFRRKGLTASIIRAAEAFAKDKGAKILEAYPIDTGGKPYGASFAWTGFVSSFRKCGYRQAARRSPTRPIMRRAL